ncbi:MAG: Pleiotropic regulatory protein [Parcubacteria group bacterium GW2011_GWC1_38_6]|nr:MAG: Pleiotropic regulatory protein [Parcubacteria group bacterium GW2011_GWC1_38_6]
MKIKFLDLNRQYKTIKKEIEKAIHRVLDVGNFIGGSEVESFEKEVAGFCGSRYALSLNSGTDALYLSLKALGVKSGDEVITTPFTFFATAEAIANTGARPIFIDIEKDSFNIDPQKIAEKLAQLKKLNKLKKLKAILPVHLFGQVANMGAIMKIAKKYKIKVVEDAAQSFGAKIRLQVSSSRFQEKRAGAIGNVGCFSFFPSKNLGAYGDGGMVLTNDQNIAATINLLKNHGSSINDKYKNLIIGTNSRLDTIQAAILKIKLKHINEWNGKRIKIAQYYNKHLQGVIGITTPSIDNNIFHQYTIRVSSELRDKLASFLSKKGIPTMIYYFLPLHLQPVFKYFGNKVGDFPESERAAREVLSLPIYPELTKVEQDFILKKIKDFYEK